MNAPPKVGYLGRTFGWSGSRHEWLVLSGVIVWLALGWGIHVLARRLTLGESILLYALWILLFGLVARDAVRNLFGPVFFYDVVRTGRQRLTFIVRWLYTLLVSFTLTMLYYFWLDGKVDYFRNPNPVIGMNELSQFGTEFFMTFIVMQFIVVVLLTPVYVAGTICIDKERKILEFLFATDLRNREIIFGKLASRILNLLMFVLVGLPILAFVQLFGGVDPEQLLACTVATIVTIIGLSALGIWFSTMLKKARDAIMLTYLSYAAYLFVTMAGAVYTNIVPLKGWWNTPLPLGNYSFGLNDVLGWLADGNIFWNLLLMSGPRGVAGTFVLEERLTAYVVFWAIASALLLGHAILRLRTVTLNQAYGASGGTRSRKKKIKSADGSEAVVVNELRRTYPPMGNNPVLWKEVFVDSGTRGGWIARLIFGIIVLAMIAPFVIIIWNEFIDPWTSTRNRTFSERWYNFRETTNVWIRVITGILTLLIILAAAVRGAGAVSGEKDKDTWISLLGTSLSSDEILMGKFWGCVLGLRKIYFFLLLIWMLGLALGAVNPVMILFTAILIALYVSAFSGIGLYCSMTSRTTLIATVRAFFAAIFCAGGFWLVILCCCVLPLSFSGGGGRGLGVPASLLLGMTPPFVAGWMPLLDFDHSDMGPFHPRERDSLGPLAPILGTMIWAGASVIVYVVCKWKFSEITNRVAQRPVGPRRRVRTPEESEESENKRYDDEE